MVTKLKKEDDMITQIQTRFKSIGTDAYKVLFGDEVLGSVRKTVNRGQPGWVHSEGCLRLFETRTEALKDMLFKVNVAR